MNLLEVNELIFRYTDIFDSTQICPYEFRSAVALMCWYVFALRSLYVVPFCAKGNCTSTPRMGFSELCTVLYICTIYTYWLTAFAFTFVRPWCALSSSTTDTHECRVRHDMAKRRISLLLPPSTTNRHNSLRHTQTHGDSARTRTRSTRRRVDFSDANARARHASRVCTYVYCVCNSYYSKHKIHILRITYNMYDVYVHVHILLNAFV